MNQQNQRTELKPFEASDQVRDLKSAILSDLTIRKTQDDEPIKQALRYVFLLIGLKADQIPDEIEKVVLLKFIRDNYANLNPEEIKIAFELALKGEFEADLNHFGNFSPFYLSKVLNSYSEFRAKKVLEIEKEKRSLEKPKETSEEEKLQIEREFLSTVVSVVFDKYKQFKKLDLMFAPAELVFKSVEKFVHFNEDQLKVIREDAKKRLQKKTSELEEKRAGSFQEHKLLKDLLISFQDPEKRSNFYREYCFEIAIEKAFDHLIENNVEFKSLIN